MLKNFKHKTLVLLFVSIIAGCSLQEEPRPEASSDSATSMSNAVVSITFDDGNADNYLVRQALAENNLHATFYVVSGFTGSTGYMTLDELQGLFEDGNEIGGHTLSHTSLGDVRGFDLRNEICRDRANLMEFGFDVMSFSYPYGYYDEESMAVVKGCGYNNARIVTGGPQEFPWENPYELKAMPYVVGDTDVSKLKRYIQEAANENAWAILTFHHICDYCDKFSFRLDQFEELSKWLGEQQSNHGLKVMTIAEVVGGDVQPVVLP